MKKVLLLILLTISSLPQLLLAQNENNSWRLSREEFEARHQSYISKYAELTEAEAKKFFPLYKELQDKRREYSEAAHKMMRDLHGENVSEAQYKSILESLSNNAIANETMEKMYLDKFKDVISYKKIFKIKEAESRFRQDLVRGMGRGHSRHKSSRGQVPDAPVNQ